MSRTKEWQKKMDSLQEKEKALLKDLEFTSGKLEKRSLIILGIAGIVAIGLIAVFSKSKTKKSANKKTDNSSHKKSADWNISSFVTEKLSVAVISWLIDRFQEKGSQRTNTEK